MRKILIIFCICIFAFSCKYQRSEEDLLLDSIISLLNNDIENSLSENTKLNEQDKLILIDSLISVRYSVEDLGAYACAEEQELKYIEDTLKFRVGMYVKEVSPKYIEIYYHNELIKAEEYESELYELNLKPETLGKDSIYIIINTNNKEYADVIYFNVVE